MLTLVLTRHGLTARSEPEQHLGQQIDIGLSDAGRAEAGALGRRLAGVAFERIVTSPLRRAVETADIVRSSLAAPPEVEREPRLAEMDYGTWEGLTYDEIRSRDAELRARWEADPASTPCPDGESGDDVAARARAFLADLLAWHDRTHASAAPPERPVLAVAHSSLNRILVCVAADIPVNSYRQRLTQDPANLTVLRFEHGDGPADARLVTLNDTAHLERKGSGPWR
jgi:probable phosphoglycerate mutase